MKLYDIIAEEKTRLDPACWTGKKIGNPKTKVKGGVRVNNCVPAESVAEDAVTDFVTRGGQIQQGKLHKPRKGETWQGSSHIGAAGGRGTKGTVSGRAANTNPRGGKPVVTAEGSMDAGAIWNRYGHYNAQDLIGEFPNLSPKDAQTIVNFAEYGWSNHINRQKYRDEVVQRVQQAMSGEQGVAEGFNGEYDDEAGMADNNLETLRRAVDGIDNVINTGDNLPEWCQEKIAVAKSMLVTVWDYMRSEEQIEDPEIAEMYEAMQLMAESMAHKHRVSVDLVWESFEALDDHMLYETAAWRRKEGKSAKGGLNAKGVASYRRENPGSKLQTAVTTKPSKLKPGSKAAKRRKSFCARMSGVKGPAKKPNGKPTRKTLALRKWNC